MLAVAVTAIEVALIVTSMVSGGQDSETLARDTVFAAVMITCNGIAGLALLVGALRHNTTHFNAEGTSAALATVATLATTCLVLPTFTTSAPGPVFSPSQLAFAAVASLVLYLMFVLTQTVRHRDFFLPIILEGTLIAEDDHAEPPSDRAAVTSLRLLLVALTAVVGLAKIESKPIERSMPDSRSRSSVSSSPCLCCSLRRWPHPERAAGPDPDEPQPGLRFPRWPASG